MAWNETPPDGYELPKVARELVEHAKAQGWLTGILWTPEAYDGEPYVAVHVGRKVGDRRWYFKVTWHSRDCDPGKLRKFGAGLESTPDHPKWRDGRSIKSIRQVISNNPMATS